jgi:uncharacterized protein YqeY
MTYRVLDVESTIFQKGNPFSRRNKLVLVGIGDYQGLDRQEIQDRITATNLLVGFNIKFDLHWIKRYEIDFSHCAVWDCQLAHFLLTGQSNPYPSLNSVASEYGLGSKLDVVADEYWSKGIDTDQIPEDVLQEYLEQDLLLTDRVYHHQLELFKTDPQLYKLFKLHCQDLLVLQEMEWNGMLFDVKKAKELAEQETKKITEIEQQLTSALKARDEVKTRTLRLVLARLKNEYIHTGRELTDAEVLGIIQSEYKRRKEAAEEFVKGNRPELAAGEMQEAEVLVTFLPPQASDSDIRSAIEELAAENSWTAADFGVAMKQLKERFGSSADGAVLSKLLREKLN